MNLFKIRPIQIDMASVFTENNDLQLFNEAVFTGAKAKMEKIDKAWEDVQTSFKEELDKHDNLHNQSKFSSEKFFKHECWKKIEDACIQVFGFRYLKIMPFPNEYLGKGKFMQMWVNAGIDPEKRFPIDGLVTKDGFYDSTHSLTGEMYIALPGLQMLTAKELTAILLHEIGHNIDPALVDIRYSQINEYSKYITDTKSNKADADNSAAAAKFGWYALFVFLCTIVCIQFAAITGFTGFLFLLVVNAFYHLIGKPLWKRRINPFMMNPEAAAKKLSKEVVKDIKKNDMFNKKNNIEAFADNFARMYGYGAIELRSLKKMEDESHNRAVSKLYGKWALSSRALAEGLRSQLFARIMVSSINDVHKTQIHRLHSMIKEYESEMKDELIPENVKKQIKYDFDQVLKVAKLYFTSPDNVKNKIYINIFKALQETNNTETTVEDILNAPDDVDVKKESVDNCYDSEILLEKVDKLRKAKNKENRKNLRSALRSKIKTISSDNSKDAENELNFNNNTNNSNDVNNYMRSEAPQSSDNYKDRPESSNYNNNNSEAPTDNNGLAPLFKLENHLATYKSLKSRFENADPSQKNNLLNKFVNGVQGSLQFGDMEKLYNELNQTRISVIKTEDDPLISLFNEDRRINKFKMTEGFISDTIKIHAPAKYFNLIEASRIFVEAYYTAQKVGTSPTAKFMKVRELIRDNNDIDKVMTIKSFDQMLASIKAIKNNITDWGSSNKLKGGAKKGALKDSEIKPILREMSGLVKEAYDNNKPFMRAIPMLIIKSLDLRSRLMKRVLDSIR